METFFPCLKRHGKNQMGESMVLIGIFVLCILLFVLPALVGELFTGVDKQAKCLPFKWISGQIFLWAGFQFICVPLVLLQKDYSVLRLLFSGFTGAAVFAAVCLICRNRYQNGRRDRLHLVREPQERKKAEWIAWGIFAALLVFQLIQAVRMTYADGDDAYYVALSASAENSGMYVKIPYTGKTTELDIRHGLAPFPMWIAFLAGISGLPAVSVAHVAVPVALIAMTYGIFYLMGRRFFPKRKEILPVFLIFTELLVLFGDYSFYTAENFMIARSRQGKAALGSILIPALFLLLMILLEKVQQKEKISLSYWLLFGAVMTAGCLCSTLGALLTCMLTGVAGLCGSVCYKKPGLLLPMALCCTPCVLFAALYLVL